MKITKKIEWDMGHRVTNHNSQCRNLHGHRYRAEIGLTGETVKDSGVSDQGMIIDFGDVKKIAMEYVHEVLDHGFMYWDKDQEIKEFFKNNPMLKHLAVPFVPTAENIAVWIFKELDSRFVDCYKTGLKLDSITIWETPTSTATCTRSDIE